MNNMNGDQIGAVYSMTNAAPNNQVIAFGQKPDGTLCRIKAFNTGGSGTGEQTVDPLGSQGSVILSRNGHFLFAVNAGSNSISSFKVSHCGFLDLIDVQPSCGVRPNSLASFDDLLYVTNAGDPSKKIASNVAGFHVDECGCLCPIDGSKKPLSMADAQPACVVFSPRGYKIVVSEVNTNRLSVFFVKHDGTLSNPVVNNSSGNGPFGSVFLSRGPLLVSEAGTNALSSYKANSDGTLDVISASVLNHQVATCWVALSPDEHYAYTSNTGSHTLTTYRTQRDGSLTLMDIVYSTQDGAGAPIDSGASIHGCHLYVLNGNEGSISVFKIMRNGRLAGLQTFRDTGLPTLGAQGLAVWNRVIPY